jgi:hypothetical protein
MKYYYEERMNGELEEGWEEEILDGDWEEEELYDDELIEYTYGLDENELRNKWAPDPKENPSRFSKTGVYKLQNLTKEYKFLTIGLRTKINPNAKLFYTVRFWWVNRDRSRKKLVDWAVYGPTEAYYINIPVSDVIGVYTSKGYEMSSDIFIEYRVDEEVSTLGWKSLQKRDAIATFTKEGKEISNDDFKKIQQGGESDLGGMQPKPKYEGFFGGIMQFVDNLGKFLIILTIILAIAIAFYIFIWARYGNNRGILGGLLGLEK